MGYRIGAANGQYRQMGAEGCVIINPNKDFTERMIEELLEDAESGEALVSEGGERDVIVTQFEKDNRHQECFTERALRKSLEPYMAG